VTTAMDPIRIEGKYGAPRVRDGLILCFFRQDRFGGWAAAVGKAFEHWLSAVVPKEAVAHAAVGSSANKVEPVDGRTVAACREQLDAGKAAKRKITGFELGGPQKLNPDHLFLVWGSLDAERKAGNTRTNVVEMRLPTEFLDKTGDALAKLAADLAAILDPDSGYASLALHWSTDSELIRASDEQVPLALRHPGFDLHHSAVTRYHLGRRTRGARWWTYLGPELVTAVGGTPAFATLPPEVEVAAVGTGVAMRVKGLPRPGDVNRKDDLPPLRAMAKLIEPVTFFADEDFGRQVFADEQELLARWERRFLD